ncbi:hypothetical protein SKAU_G00074340 [Synaphobranchus kaupii]|uniref:Uncharacterized protein n=1 Tax=Synaphobranchus kaupii TaxID=118154 RepID=A0A9Q1G8I9_SYNKA|nr:hypothetical protein SKAU_G00074340 [Synaphobranchus kaupii]
MQCAGIQFRPITRARPNGAAPSLTLWEPVRVSGEPALRRLELARAQGSVISPESVSLGDSVTCWPSGTNTASGSSPLSLKLRKDVGRSLQAAMQQEPMKTD